MARQPRNSTVEHIASEGDVAERDSAKSIDETRVSRRYARLMSENYRDFLNGEIDIKDCNRMNVHLWRMAAKAGVDGRVRALLLENVKPLATDGE